MNKFLKHTFIVMILIVFCMASTACSEEKGTTVNHENDSYDAKTAVKYALEYAEKRNLDYPDFDNNCTNFVSQCLVAGGLNMDQAPKPQKNKRGIYENDTNLWYYSGVQFDEEKPPHFTCSYSFVRTGDFIEYWTNSRGFEIKEYENTFGGRAEMRDETDVGSVFLYYDTEDEIVHIGMVTDKDENSLYYTGNTTDRTNMSTNEFNNFVYPKYGIIDLSEK